MSRHYESTEIRRRQVAEAALEALIEVGARRFTTREVARRVGIADGTLFRHFGNKEEIVLEAMRLLDAEIEAGLVDTGDDAADLETFFRHRATFVGAPDSFGRLIFSEELQHLAGEAGRDRLETWRRRSVDYLDARLKALQRDGTLRSDLHPKAAALIVQGILLTFARAASLFPASGLPPLQVRIDQAWGILETVLFRRPPA